MAQAGKPALPGMPERGEIKIPSNPRLPKGGRWMQSPVAALEKSGKKAPLGAKKNRDEGLTGRGSWVTKTGAAGGGKLTKNKRTSHKDLDSGAKVDIILSSKTCSLKTK